jgi:hypothetical protein
MYTDATISLYKNHAPFDHHLHFIKNERKSYQHILSSSFELINTLQFDYIVDELTKFINNSNLFQEIFLGMDPYTNNELTHFNSICTCFPDVAYNLLMFVDLGLGISFRFPIEAKGGTTPLPDTIPFYSMSSYSWQGPPEACRETTVHLNNHSFPSNISCLLKVRLMVMNPACRVSRNRSHQNLRSETARNSRLHSYFTPPTKSS